MGLQDELGYVHAPPNALQRVTQRVAATRPGAWAMARLLPPVDRGLHRLSGGRLSAPGVLAGLPVVMVTTTGRRSGRSRTAPLIAVPVDGDLALIGTNFGRRSTPAWVHNLEARPTATVSYGDASVPVVATRVEGDEAERVFTASATVYPGYLRYRERIVDRDVRVFVLSPA